MNKFLLSLVSVISSTAFAQETAVKQPEFWSPVVEHQIQRDIPQYLGYTDNAGLLMSTYDPNSVSSGYLGFLQSAEMISNLIFAYHRRRCSFCGVRLDQRPRKTFRRIFRQADSALVRGRRGSSLVCSRPVHHPDFVRFCDRRR